MPRLVCLTGKLAGKEFPVTDRMRVGRLDTCDVVVVHDDVSREHATLRREGSGWVVQDLGSKNGTSVNGKRAGKAPLASGDRIGLGDLAFRFVDEAASAKAPAPAPPGESDEHEPEDERDAGHEHDEGEGAGDPEGSGEEPSLESSEERSSAPTPVPGRAGAAGRGGPMAARGFAFEAGLTPRQRELLETFLFAIVCALAFLCASVTTEVVLRLVAV